MATEEEDDQRTSGRKIWRRRCGQQNTSIQHWRKMEAAAQNRAKDGEEWSVTAYVRLK